MSNPSNASQAERFARIESPLGTDVLLLHRMTGAERLSEPFRYDLELLSEDLNIKLEDLLSEALTISIDLPDGGERHFHGVVTQFRFTGQEGRYARYTAVMRPWLSLLAREADCRIYQDMSALEIVKDVFQEHGFTDFDTAGITRSCRTREYCVQYRETDFQFVSRLLEEEGIYYYFKHDASEHVLMLGDDYGAHAPETGYADIPYFPPDDHGRRERDHISDWQIGTVFQPGTISLEDYNFTMPKAELMVKSVIKSHPAAAGEIYDYPGKYTNAGEGEVYARIRNEELQAQYELAEGAGNAMGIAVGNLFSLTDYPRQDQNKEYLIVSATFMLSSDLFATGGNADGDPFQVRFTAMDSKVPFRPARKTPKAVVRGPHTATVVGPGGAQVHVDQYGRVKVQFHWDRNGQQDDNSSCWVRVAQFSAGSRWGAMFKPFVGHEVVVEFLEGDPDRPLITGSVYNENNMPPEELPSNNITFIFRDVYHNEIRFEGDRKYISIYSPTFNSTLNLGITGILLATENNYIANVRASYNINVGADKMECVKGKNLKVEGEDAFSFATGTKFEMFGGTKLDVMAGTNFKWQLSTDVEFTYGVKRAFSATKEYKTGEEDWTNHYKKEIIFNSDKKVLIAGGSGAKTSYLDVCDDRLELTFGATGKPPVAASSGAIKAAAGMAMAGSVAAGAAALTSWQSAQTKKDAIAHGDTDIAMCEDNEGHIHNIWQHVNSWTGRAVGAIGAVMGILGAVSKTQDIKISPTKRNGYLLAQKDGVMLGGDPAGKADKKGDAQGWLVLGKTGQAAAGVEILSNNKDVYLESKKKNVTIKAKEAVDIHANDEVDIFGKNKVHIVGKVIQLNAEVKHKNFQVKK